ncbi:helix-turn-helix transcriptional regulator [Vibrio parahaemolyticus]|uniref:AraC family transcriptional regulator n=1 Tax=Vibrio parahaemolyticus TaxID=670 RepID=UPI001EEA7321|nr:helix-turn-helix transcriptional regulator [Vibrio parahaemolyticus]MCG6489971.1 helix-turn-helix transcriptional regulator [Vibrio parahaemolyticus]
MVNFFRPIDYEVDNYSPVVGRVDFSEPELVSEHCHERHQLSYAISGVLHITTHAGEWVLPPSRALWIKAGTSHSSEVKRQAQIRTLYIDPAVYPSPGGNECLALEVTPLVRELILACAALPWKRPIDSAENRLGQCLVDQLQVLSSAPVNIPMPSDMRALRIVEILQQDPGNKQSLRELALHTGASSRTIERIFNTQTMMSFRAWRTRYRLICAVERLAYGESVANVAFDVGYESASSFVYAFRCLFGTTPSKYFQISQSA